MKNLSYLLTAGLCFTPLSALAADPVDTLLAEYRAAGAGDFSAEAGQALWRKTFTVKNEERACTTCHGEDLTQAGKQVNTGKVIEPLAPSANPERLTKIKHIKKWLKRNCKWTLGRECDAQEKGDVLSFLRTQ